MPLINRLISETSDPRAIQEFADTILSQPDASRRLDAKLADGRFIDIWTAPVKGPDGKIYGRAVYCRDVTAAEAARSGPRSRGGVDRIPRGRDAACCPSRSRSRRSSTVSHTWPYRRSPTGARFISSTRSVSRSRSPSPTPTRRRCELARDMQDKYPARPTRGDGRVRRDPQSRAAADERDPGGTAASKARRTTSTSSSSGRCSCGQRSSSRSSPAIARSARSRSSPRSPGAHTTKTTYAASEELAARAAFPIDNARLYAESRRVAQTLQKSFLPPDLPAIPGVDISARYFAAGEGELIGGDFYDAFRIDSNRWGIVLGDVSGKGLEAATVTTLARHTIRGAALTAQRPSEVLRRPEHRTHRSDRRPTASAPPSTRSSSRGSRGCA